MKKKLKLEILGKERIKILPLLKIFKFLPGKEKKPKEVFTLIEKKVKLFLTRAV
ncbi:MAG: hypothetical protein M0P61_02095 [Ignavibacteriaceae bacterium]|jgi:hypothetical protein|nr:hypothetical protein [Ignavibacteriaceae bacterium]